MTDQPSEQTSGQPDGGGPRTQFGGVLRPLAWLDGLIAHFEAFVLAAGVMIMASVSVANVIGRFVLGESLFFVEELNRFLIVLITFVGLGYAARMGRHIRMSAIYDALPDGLRKALMVVICLITSAAMFTLAWYASVYVVGVFESGRMSASLRIPVYITFLWVPVGFVITGIQYLLTAVANLSRPDVYLSASIVDTYEDTETKV